MTFIKIYGERNSGTNYLEQLVSANLGAKVLRYVPSQRIGRFLRYETLVGLLSEWYQGEFLGWKHGKPKIKAINRFQQELLTITLTKNPYSFLLSLYKRSYHYRGNREVDFKTFLQQEWVTILRDNCRERSFASPIDLWNAKNQAYLDLPQTITQPVIHVRYEELLQDPLFFIDQLVAVGDTLAKKREVFDNPSYSTKGDNLSFEDYQAYYLHEEWRSLLDQEAICLINNRLDFPLVEALGYQKINP